MGKYAEPGIEQMSCMQSMPSAHLIISLDIFSFMFFYFLKQGIDRLQDRSHFPGLCSIPGSGGLSQYQLKWFQKTTTDIEETHTLSLIIGQRLYLSDAGRRVRWFLDKSQITHYEKHYLGSMKMGQKCVWEMWANIFSQEHLMFTYTKCQECSSS